MLCLTTQFNFNMTTIRTLSMLCLLACLLAGTACESAQQEQTTDETAQEPAEPTPMNTLTEAEKAEGWELLFDGKTTEGWHNYLKEDVQGWMVENGELITQGQVGDIVTDEEFGDFELYFEWKISPEGNSGVIYRVVEDEAYSSTYITGPEFQLIDDENYPGELQDVQKSGANYALDAPSELAANPAGTYNTSRIRIEDGTVEHWLNGVKVVTYELGSPAWEEKVAQTKFKDMPDYGKAERGHIALQDHSDPVSFRNIKIRRL